MITLYFCIVCGNSTNNKSGVNKGNPFRVYNRPMKICAGCYYHHFAICNKCKGKYTIKDIEIIDSIN